MGRYADLIRESTKPGMAGLWLDEHSVVEAARKVHSLGYKSIEVLSPYPMHHIDDAIGLKRSFVPWITFTFGMLGCSFGAWFTWWVAASDWPINIAGKPMWSLPAFIPVIFECTILFAALSSVGALIYLAGLPKFEPAVIDPDLTSHKFGIFIYGNDKKYNEDEIKKLFNELGADEVKASEF